MTTKLPEYKIDVHGNVFGRLGNDGACHIPCRIRWSEDDPRNVFHCEDEGDLKCIVEAIAKEPGFYFQPQDVIKFMTQPVLNQTQVTSGLRQTSLDVHWSTW